MRKLSQTSCVVQSRETNRKSFEMHFRWRRTFERAQTGCWDWTGVASTRGDVGSWRHSWSADVRCRRAEGHCHDRPGWWPLLFRKRWKTVSRFSQLVSEGSDYSLILIVPSAQPFTVASRLEGWHAVFFYWGRRGITNETTVDLYIFRKK